MVPLNLMLMASVQIVVHVYEVNSSRERGGLSGVNSSSSTCRTPSVVVFRHNEAHRYGGASYFTVHL